MKATVQTKGSLRQAVSLAAALEGVIAIEVREIKPWRVELVSAWGGVPNPVSEEAKSQKARAIVDRLATMGFEVAHDVLCTGGFDVYFELA